MVDSEIASNYNDRVQNQAAITEGFEAILRKKHLKSTPQRVAILRQIQESGHISIEELYERIRKLHPSISLATVYIAIIIPTATAHCFKEKELFPILAIIS